MKVAKKHWIITIGICILIIAFVSTIIFVLFFTPQRTYTITETFRITSKNGSDTYLQVILPVSGGYQEIKNLFVDGADGYSIEYFNGWRELTAKVPSTGYEVNVIISYTATLSRNTSPWSGYVREDYTLPQQFIDSDNEAIIALATQLRGTDDFQTARNIHDHVYNLISWPPSGSRVNIDRLYASEILESPVGVCGDFANLMVALLRAENIPARAISGLVLQFPMSRVNDWGHQGGSHAWVEFYANGNWHFADPSWGWFDRNATTHLSFGTYEAYVGSDFQRNIIDDIESAGFFVRGAMSAPLRFVFYSTDENATVTPRGEVSFSLLR